MKSASAVLVLLKGMPITKLRALSVGIPRRGIIGGFHSRCKSTNYFSFYQIFHQLFSSKTKDLTIPPFAFNISLPPTFFVHRLSQIIFSTDVFFVHRLSQINTDYFFGHGNPRLFQSRVHPCLKNHHPVPLLILNQ